ncbi:MAG: hypothetical protein COV91_03065 [Candidatus Taylorbacteria bacterium CG11_big_fil_rev_8_21_14_0_20_46_11]|uniref:ROK family protein n=1 Tax=Candidatus Taylorbacteria bacterium CG11_big_fil_rev_8_21_14_0_20_46_11 TaxID=1975025 RepID=A0A2H0KBP6_9BACT|nr:MAG: hypothetical protein COV91_03065 [Candidatus Taylorbacteria bacterium CG11_big_fil_rev_8_21_14_0_20_46_11]
MFLLFDIGGTNMRVAVSHDGITLGAQKSLPTPRDFDEGVETLSRIAQELCDGNSLVKAVGGVAGTLDTDRNVLIHSPNNGGWKGKPLREALEKALGVPVRLENDAALAGLGEAVHGAGKGFSIVVYFTISTGIGGARIVEGNIDASAYGFEPGFQIIDMCDREAGYLEARASGSALRKKFGVPAEEITDEAVWKEFEQTLAVGIHNSLLHWSPDVVVLGGAIAEKGRFFSVERVHEHATQLLRVLPTTPVFKKAELGDDGGLYGGLALLSR